MYAGIMREELGSDYISRYTYTTDFSAMSDGK